MLRISSKHLIQRKWRGFSLSSQRYLSSESNNEPILKKFPSPFPWRSSPFIIEFPWSISMKHSIMKFFYFRFVSDISEEEFVQGAIAAYSGSTSNLLQYIESRTNDSDADESILKTTFTPILATFYQKWLNDFFQQYPRGSIKIHHKVFDDKDAPAIALIKAVTASTRTSITEDTFQSIAPLKFEEYKRNKLEDIASIEQEDGRKEVAINTVYIRYDVNIQCKGNHESFPFFIIIYVFSRVVLH